jgi:hypothetical protein
MQGFVYILTNPAMPGVIKIGHTIGTPKARAAALSHATGVPLPFEVAAYASFQEPAEVEAHLHLNLSPWRLNERREFFQMDGEHEALRNALELLYHHDDVLDTPWVAAWALASCGLSNVCEIVHPMAWAERAVM